MAVEKKRSLTPTNQRLQRVSRLIYDKKKNIRWLVSGKNIFLKSLEGGILYLQLQT